MNLTPLKANFTAGELSPLMRNRTDLKGFDAGMETQLNCVSVPQGPVFSRFPFELLHVEPNEEFGSIHILQVSANLFYIMLFLDKKVKFFTDQGTPVDIGYVSNPRFSSLGENWTKFTDGSAASTVTFAQHLCRLTPRSNVSAFAGIRQQITVAAPADTHRLVVESNSENLPDELTVRIGTAPGLGDIATVTSPLDVIELDFIPNIASFYVDVSNKGDVGGDNTIILSMVEVFDLDGNNEAVTPYATEDLLRLHLIEAPAGDTIYITNQNYHPYYVEYNPTTGTISFIQVTFSVPPPEFAEGNYPATGVVHRGRLYFANTPKEPEQIWASVINDFSNFGYGTGTTLDGFSVINEHYGAIEWMLSSKSLTLGTDNAEYVISSQGPVIYIGDIQIDRQSTYGSVGIQAIQVGDKILYITRDSEKLHAMQFNRDAQTWLSEELSFPSSHIPSVGIVEIAWERTPLSLFWMVLLDGTLACMNYNRPMNIIGWHRHDTQGNFQSVAVGNKLGSTDTVVLVNRGTGGLHIEVSTAHGAPMDSRITVDVDPPSNIVTGLDPLEGLEVQVVADGAVHPNRTVVGGQIELQLEAEFVQVGLGYNKRLKTLPFDKGARTGSARSFSKRYKEVYVELLTSHVPFINGQQPPIRHPVTPMNEAEPAFDGLVKISNLGFDHDAPVTIEQDGPLTLAVGGIYGTVTQDEM